MNTPNPSLDDVAREARIESLGSALVMSSSLVDRARLWRELKVEISARSPMQVSRMETEKGLK